MKKRLTTLTLIALAVLSVSVLHALPAYAGGKCMKCEEAKKCKIYKLKQKAKMLWEHKDALGLTPEQLGQLKEIKHAAIKDMIRLKADVDVIKVDIDSEMWAEQIDAGKVSRLIDGKYDAKNKIAKTYVQALADMQKVLTDEQRTAWLEMRMWKKMNKSECGGKCGGCGKADCKKCMNKGKPGFCPITGKPLNTDKGSMKSSMKGSM